MKEYNNGGIMMIYGKEYFSTSSLLEYSLEEEMNNFSLIVENCNIDVMVESTVLDKLKELWDKFKAWVKDLWDKVFGNTAKAKKAKENADKVDEYIKKHANDDSFTNEATTNQLPFSTMSIHFNKDAVTGDMKDSTYYDRFTRVSSLSEDHDKIDLFVSIISDFLSDARNTVSEIARISDKDYDKINTSDYTMRELSKKLKIFDCIDTVIVKDDASTDDIKGKESMIFSFKKNCSSIDNGLDKITHLQKDVKSLQERAEKITQTLSYKIRQVTGEKNKKINNSISSLVSGIIRVLKEFNNALGRVISIIQRVEIYNYNSYTRAMIKMYNIPEEEVNKIIFG